MIRRRLRGAERFRSAALPTWAHFLNGVDIASLVTEERSWKPTATGPGLRAREVSEAAYRSTRRDLEAQGVIFLRTDEALAKHPDVIREAFGTVVAAEANPFAALNTALWSGGSFVYVPRGVSVAVPLQAEIRQDYERAEPFERNLILADRDSDVTFLEGCSAPVYTREQIHVSAVEVIARPGSCVRYITLQTFSKEVDNFVTKAAVVHDGASVEWVDANLGSRRTWKAPAADLVGPGARAAAYGLAVAAGPQVQDTGASMHHRAPGTRSRIVLRSIAQRGGQVVLRPEVHAREGVSRAAADLRWYSVVLDTHSAVEVVPSVDVASASVEVTQEGRMRSLGEDAVFYMASRGLGREEAVRAITMGLADDVTKRIPYEYAVEVRRLLDLELGGAVG